MPKTSSQLILSDEMNTDCATCICSTLFADDEVTCEKCRSPCHIFCMSPSNSDVCLACAAMANSMLQTSPKFVSNATQNSSQATYDDNDSPQNRSQMINDQNGSSLKTHVKTVIDILPPSNLIDDMKKKESELSQKQRELRQLETRLKKKDEDLKLKEAKIKEYEKNSMKLEMKIESLEFRNKELECTIL